MFDFFSEFWSWFIIVPTVGGMLGVLWLVIWQSEPKHRSNEEAKPMGHVWDEDLQELNNPLPRWWLNLFYFTLVFGAVYLTLYPGLGSFHGLLNWSQASMYNAEMKKADATYGPIFDKHLKTPVEELAKDADAMKTGQRMFANYCALCHGPDARGGLGFPNLTDNDWLYGGSGKNIETTIMNGRQGGMPAWGAILGKENVFNVAEYVLSLSGRKVNQTAAALGKQKFMTTCVACHGADGKGNQAIGAPNLTDKIWLYGGSQKAILDSITNGRKGKMPAHGEFLGKGKVHLLAAYVYSLSHKQQDK